MVKVAEPIPRPRHVKALFGEQSLRWSQTPFERDVRRNEGSSHFSLLLLEQHERTIFRIGPPGTGRGAERDEEPTRDPLDPRDRIAVHPKPADVFPAGVIRG